MSVVCYVCVLCIVCWSLLVDRLLVVVCVCLFRVVVRSVLFVVCLLRLLCRVCWLLLVVCCSLLGVSCVVFVFFVR